MDWMDCLSDVCGALTSTISLYIGFQEEHPTAEVEAVATPVNKLEGCIFVGHTNTDTDRLEL